MARKNLKVKSSKKFPVWGWALLAIAAVVAVVFAVFKMPKPSPAALPLEITVTQAAQKREQGAFILDVRQPEEWTQFHIPGTTLIPLGELPTRLSEIPRDRQVVVVCRAGNRSALGRDILLKAGFISVTSMAGGVTAWQSQGLPLTSGN